MLAADRASLGKRRMRCAAIGAVAIWLATGAASAGEREVARFAGPGTGATRPFTVSGPWEAQFDPENDLVAKLMTADGKLLAVAASQIGGHATYYSPRAGTFYLEIIALSPWRARVVEIVP